MRFTYLTAPVGTGRWWQDKSIMNALRTLNHQAVEARHVRGLLLHPADVVIVRPYDEPRLLPVLRKLRQQGARIWMWSTREPDANIAEMTDVALVTVAPEMFTRLYGGLDMDIFNVRRGADLTMYGATGGATGDRYEVGYCGSNSDDKTRLRTWAEPVLKEFYSLVSGPGWENRGIASLRTAADRERLVYLSARVGLNVHEDRDRIPGAMPNQRLYQIAACGVPQVCDDHHKVKDEMGDTVLWAKAPGEYREMVHYVLSDLAAATKLGRASLDRVRSVHNIVDIVRRLLADIEGG